MRDRHVPRLCHSCHAPMSRQENSCWHCATQWAGEDEGATIIRLPVPPMPAVLAGGAVVAARAGGSE